MDRETIIAVLTNFTRIEDDSEEWQSPSPYISGKQAAADHLLALITREKNAAIEQERERCAKVAERDCTNSKSSTLYVASARIAAAIRATSPQDGKEG